MKILATKELKNSCLLAIFSFTLILLMHIQDMIPFFKLFSS
ncbi:hypothetical protein [Arcobacter sp. YIC-80]